ncbi:Cna B-type domain-containing protein [Dehalobacterium formicoaceticum]|uniref:Cna B-type domain-containing protein n=1 Tax=Dehalobacterium formicoaceticum TaxID=51515 RepID=A0ABT1Y569_9FIRM|nr:Cna B-type domain-containing protein [Dehalobacterium formicoaceticum]MCR6545064.1 Cna B-type domain-containing protein [Dehalobacterium formicoaceticum]
MFDKNNKTLIFFIALLLLLSVSTIVSGVGNSSDQPACSFTVTLKEAGSHRVVPEASLTLYQVAGAKTGNVHPAYVFTEDFGDCGISLHDLNDEGLAQHLAVFAAEQGLTGIRKTSGREGSVTFDTLDPGLYLVVQRGSVSGYYAISPFLVALPMLSGDGVSLIYDVEATPKVEKRPGGGGGSSSNTAKITVKKVWAEDGNIKTPGSVTVKLLRDDEAYDTIKLSAANAWSYTWSKLSKNYRWSVAETEVPAGFTVSYATSGTTTTITNSAKKEPPGVLEPSDPSDPSNPTDPVPVIPSPTGPPNPPGIDVPPGSVPSSPLAPGPDSSVPALAGPTTPSEGGGLLVKAGQLNWPIPLLAVIGLILFAVGWQWTFLTKRKEHE